MWSLDGAERGGKREREGSLSESMTDVGVELGQSVSEGERERSAKERELEVAAMANGLF